MRSLWHSSQPAFNRVTWKNVSVLYYSSSIPDSLWALGKAEIPAHILCRTPGLMSLYCPVFLFFPYSFQSLPSHYLTTTGLNQFNLPKVYETLSVWLAFLVIWFRFFKNKSRHSVLAQSPLSNAHPVIQTAWADLQGRASCCRRQLDSSLSSPLFLWMATNPILFFKFLLRCLIQKPGSLLVCSFPRHSMGPSWKAWHVYCFSFFHSKAKLSNDYTQPCVTRQLHHWVLHKVRTFS